MAIENSHLINIVPGQTFLQSNTQSTFLVEFLNELEFL